MKKRLRKWLFWKIWSEYLEECDVDRLTWIHSSTEHELRNRMYGIRVATRSQQVEAERYVRLLHMAHIARDHA